MKLISREAAEWEMAEFLSRTTYTTSISHLNTAALILARVPDIDAVPVVRCKDCKWCAEHYDTDGNAPYWICKNLDGGTDADGFCYEAERRTDGTDK